MAHFAEIGLNNVVLRVIAIHNNELLDSDGNEQESKGAEFCRNMFGGVWVQTSYHGSIRKNFAGVGYSYNSDLDAFIPAKKYESWLLDEESCQWISPVEYPSDGLHYEWDEDVSNWKLIES
jgi:hypothetical protein